MTDDDNEPRRLRTSKQLQDARGDNALDITNFVTIEDYRQLKPRPAVDDE